jgi:uncharacterized membrane protein HdeD (DUF308 family)
MTALLFIFSAAFAVMSATEKDAGWQLLFGVIALVLGFMGVASFVARSLAC